MMKATALYVLDESNEGYTANTEGTAALQSEPVFPVQLMTQHLMTQKTEEKTKETPVTNNGNTGCSLAGSDFPDTHPVHCDTPPVDHVDHKPASTPLANPLTELIRKNADSQNLVIHTAEGEPPECLIKLAKELSENDPIIHDLLRTFRNLYCKKQLYFNYSLSKKSPVSKKTILHLLNELTGVVAEFHYNSKADVVTGQLVNSPKAQNFITGSYMEIAMYEKTKAVLKEICKEYSTTFRLYRNVVVSTSGGSLKNEFDLIVSVNQHFYAIEVKSGSFRSFDRYIAIGREYGIVPNRLLMVCSEISSNQAQTAEYFCEYYISNLTNFEEKLRKMLENDLKH